LLEDPPSSDVYYNNSHVDRGARERAPAVICLVRRDEFVDFRPHPSRMFPVISGISENFGLVGLAHCTAATLSAPGFCL